MPRNVVSIVFMVVISAGTEFRIVASVLKCLEMLSAQCVWLLLVQVQSSELLPVYYVVLCIVVSVIIMFLLAAGEAVSVAFKVVLRVDIFFRIVVDIGIVLRIAISVAMVLGICC